MAGKQGAKSKKTTEIGPRYDELFLEALDGRSLVARALRDRLRALTSDLGGVAQLSYQERSLVRRIVHLERLIEKRELSLAHGGTVDEGSYLTAITTLSSLFSKLGLKRRAKQIQLSDYLQTKSTSEPGRQGQDNPAAIMRPQLGGK